MYNNYFAPFVLYKNVPLPKTIKLEGHYTQESGKVCYFMFALQKPGTTEIFNAYIFEDSTTVTNVSLGEGIVVDGFDRYFGYSKIYTQKTSDTFSVEFDFKDSSNIKKFA